MSNSMLEQAVTDAKAQIDKEIDEFKAVLDAGTADPESLSALRRSKGNGRNSKTRPIKRIQI